MNFSGFGLTPRGLKPSAKVWIKPNEIFRYTSKIIWITGTGEYAVTLNLLARRIHKQISKSGIKHTFLILKECMRLVVLFLSGNEQIKAPLFGTTQRVKRDSRGLPKILPVQVRSILSRCDFIKDRNILIAILSLVSIFRVMGFKVTESLKTIVSQFSGITKSYDPAILGSAIFNLFGPGRKLTFGPVKAVILESAGPNGFKSTWAASLDAVAYLFYPKEYESLIKLLIIQPRGFRYVLWMLLIQVVALPLIIILIIIGWHPNLNLRKTKCCKRSSW